MYLENVVFDALDSQRLGRFWEAVLGTEQLTDVLGGYETRLAFADGAYLDLCFQPVEEPPTTPPRLHLDLVGGERQTEVPRALRHPSRRGPVLELCSESAPKGPAKNRVHLDVRLESGEDADDVEAAIAERGGELVPPQWGALPWRTYLDPSGNEFCVLPVSS